MIAVDTSVLARYILQDSPSEHKAAAQFISANQCSVSWSVLIELGWVLERSAGLPREEVVDGISAIANMVDVTVPDEAKLEWALARYAGGADLGDMIHLAAALAGSTEFATFDRQMAKQAGDSPPLPIRTLRS